MHESIGEGEEENYVEQETEFTDEIVDQEEDESDVTNEFSDHEVEEISEENLIAGSFDHKLNWAGTSIMIALGFGMPFQGSFFWNKNLPKYKKAEESNLNNAELRTLIPPLGIVFPDNNNHLHIQVTLTKDVLQSTSYETETGFSAVE